MTDARTARRVALDALTAVAQGARANVVVPGLLDACALEGADRRFVTELVYGTTRMRRACDWLVDRHLRGRAEPAVRDALRLGAYQLAFLGTPPHAAVSETVAETPPRARGLVNAVLRRVSEALPPTWPDVATELSYPDWIVERLIADLGPEDALAALRRMNEAASATEREDGYIQDLASQWVAELVDAGPGSVVADVCAAPGGKATAMARRGADVVLAGDVEEARARVVAENGRRLGLDTVAPVVGDARRVPARRAVFDRVLVDAPCSGLGVLRRRPDARWRVRPDDVERLARLQRDVLHEAVGLVRPGGQLVYSVCTLTRAETAGVDRWLAERHPELVPLPPPMAPWRAAGRGALLLPQDADTDGMFLLRLRREP